MYPLKNLVDKKPRGYNFKSPENDTSGFLTILKLKKYQPPTPDLVHTNNYEAVRKKAFILTPAVKINFITL